MFEFCYLLMVRMIVLTVESVFRPFPWVGEAGEGWGSEMIPDVAAEVHIPSGPVSSATIVRPRESECRRLFGRGTDTKCGAGSRVYDLAAHGRRPELPKCSTRSGSGTAFCHTW